MAYANYSTLKGDYDGLKEQISDLQIQLYIAMAVGFSAILIMLIIIIVFFGVIERIKVRVELQKIKRRSHYSTSTGSREEILPQEEMSRRGFRRYPSYSSELVSRVETRDDSRQPSSSRQPSLHR